ncbi:cation:proton antiporter [Phenylobacterium sp.]|uniref:cation:proton antiporter n=1 Tax=Phenylobacterium sp. TaxID=1871053 RepID=UPI002C905430|nr:cation:proton antiporter [Phenylobacterium sp.]HVI31217.1 cation:proton antiporter [Phenylobacterium sp.]
MTTAQLSVAFFLQMAVILAACRVVGWIGHRSLGQPQVMGEMVAGVILGPSLFGLLAPDLQAAVFPKESRDVLYVGAQLGIGLYMFLVGLDFRRDHFRANAASAAAVSVSGMVAPFLVAALIAPWLMDLGLFGDGVDGVQAWLFIGAAISITAFPMLARILNERGVTGTPLGSLSLAAGAMGDAAAWCVLAVVLATVGDGATVAVKAIVGGVAFVAMMTTLGPRLLAPLGRIVEREGRLTPGVLSVVMITFMASAFAMDYAGLHAVFGGFVLGAVMPRGRLAAELKRMLEPFAVVVLLPLFFTYSGLNTQLTMVDSVGLLGVTVAVLGGSIIAKGVACWAAARLTGQDNPTAMAIGALMNARGMMELILVNIALQRGLIGPGLFSMLVLMAIVTTFMATPLFELVYGRRARARGELGALSEAEGAERPAVGAVAPSS